MYSFIKSKKLNSHFVKTIFKKLLVFLVPKYVLFTHTLSNMEISLKLYVYICKM